MIKRYCLGIMWGCERYDDEAILEEAPEGRCVLVEDMISRLYEICTFNRLNKEDASEVLNQLYKLIEELEK